MHEDLLTEVLPSLRAAEWAIRNGDAGPRIAQWTTRGDASWLGPFGTCTTGRNRVVEHFAAVAARFTDCASFSFEVVATEASAGLAQVTGIERAVWRIDRSEPTAMTMRVSRTYRREDGAWRIAHGHADIDPASLSLPWKPPRRPR